LNNAIRKLRQALNDDADHPHYIETLAKRGYRFVAPVTQAGDTPQQSRETAEVSRATAAAGTASSSRADSTVVAGRRVWPWVLVATAATLVLVGGLLAWKATHTPPPLASEQRITANPPEAPVTSAVISPDENYVAYSDPTGVYIRHITSGETRPLQLPVHFDAVVTSWFPDSTHLLLVANEVGNEVPCVWRVSILGGDPQKVVENATTAAVSPDGSAIAFLRIGTDYLELWVSGNDGSDARRIVEAVAPAILAHTGNWASNKLYTGSGIARLAWSPGGKRIAYVKSLWTSYPDPSMDNRFTLETVGTSGGAPKVLEDSMQLRPALA